MRRRRRLPKPPVPEGYVSRPRSLTAVPEVPATGEIHLSFREITRALYSAEHLPALMEQVQKWDDRTVCLILSAMLERNLEYLILTRIGFGFNLNEERRDQLFAKDGTLSSFHANIIFSRALEVINDDTMKDLNIIRDVRNKFAHSALPLHFKVKAIKGKLGTLREGRYPGLFVEEHVYSHLTAERREFIFSAFMVLHEIRDMVDRLNEFISDIHDAVDLLIDVKKDLQ
jgi:hypothetical protein